MKINITIVFSMKHPVRKYIYCYTFINKLMNQARLQTCAASVVECLSVLSVCLSECSVTEN